MRVKITALTESHAAIPFNYNYALHSAIYGLLKKSSGEYSKYLHDKGFINETVKRRFKLFTFSKLFFTPTRIQKNGFNHVKEITFIFSTPIEKSYEHLILGLFSDQTFYKTDYADHDNKHEFKFSFDVNYIAKRQGKISKLIHFKKIDNKIRTKIKGFEAPFRIVADPMSHSDNKAGTCFGCLYGQGDIYS